MEKFQFFNISFYSLNLFSFMLGVTWAFFNQGIFGKQIGKYIFVYFGGLALYYATMYYLSENPTTITEVINSIKNEATTKP